ncbi:exonuclease domain-containing protein [Spiroplasma endosymbiont of Nebria brevicollis]|uniref:exonuclease domain-containing protein n=1 Tax=Spiroplasma endosymbiont of Nebria brevicollis TaxID=3066284 RepID=UPI00313E2C46
MSLKIPDSNIIKDEKEKDSKNVLSITKAAKPKFKAENTNLFAKTMLLNHKQAILNNKKQFSTNPWGVDNHIYVFISFETANIEKTSACQLAIIKVQKGKIIDSYETFIKPYPYEFTFSHINKITEKKVENAPIFRYIWEKVSSFFEEKYIIIAHNASYNINVLRSLLQHYKLECPNFLYVCSIKLFKKAYNYPNNKLNALAHNNKIKFNHNETLAGVKTLHSLINVHFGSHYHIKNLSEKLNINLGNLFE